MKKLFKQISRYCRRRRYRRVFEKWFIYHLTVKDMPPYMAVGYAESIMTNLCPHFIEYEDYLDFLLQEYCGKNCCREQYDGDIRLNPKPWYRPNPDVR